MQLLILRISYAFFFDVRYLGLISSTVPAGLRIQDPPLYDQQDPNFQPPASADTSQGGLSGSRRASNNINSASSSSSRVVFVLPASSPNAALIQAWARLPFGLSNGGVGAGEEAPYISTTHSGSGGGGATAAVNGRSAYGTNAALTSRRFSTPGAPPLMQLLSTCAAVQLAAQMHALVAAAQSDHMRGGSNSSGGSSTSSSSSNINNVVPGAGTSSAIIREAAETLTEWAGSLEPQALAAVVVAAAAPTNIVQSASSISRGTLLARLPLLLTHFMQQHAQDSHSNQVSGGLFCSV